MHIPRSGLAVLGNVLFATFLTSTVALGFARISIACMLLQVAQSRRSRVAIWATIALQVAVMLMYIIAQLVQCNSVIARKIKIQESQCLTPSQIWSYTYASTSELSSVHTHASHSSLLTLPGIAIFSDLLCTIIPICLLKNLTRSRVEKILISILLGSCLLGTGACIARIYYMVIFDFSSPDGFYLMVDRFIWSRAEESLLIIAACAPLMKSPIERFLKRLGLAQGFSVPQRQLNEVSVWSQSKETDSHSGSHQSNV
jgi:hypothetical protein